MWYSYEKSSPLPMTCGDYEVLESRSEPAQNIWVRLWIDAVFSILGVFRLGF